MACKIQPLWFSGQVSTSTAGDAGTEPCFLRSGQPSDLKTGAVVTTCQAPGVTGSALRLASIQNWCCSDNLPGAWRYRVISKTGQHTVTGAATSICNFCLSVALRAMVRAGPWQSYNQQATT